MEILPPPPHIHTILYPEELIHLSAFKVCQKHELEVSEVLFQPANMVRKKV